MDPRDLNEALEREPYHTCSVDEITAKLQGMTVFTIVDFKKGYCMVVLHPESRKLTSIMLPFGRFQWTRLPMGTVVPIQAGFHLYWHGRCHRNCQ